MCGILGYVGQYSPELLATARDSLAHRGPDDHGLWFSSDRSVGLGHTRLAIIGLGRGGAQPMVDAESGCVLVFNGEIYNFQDLRQSLMARGHVFHGSSDTEVVLKLMAYDGVDAVQRLNGMFALGFWDPRLNALTLARDRFGIKPLYWRRRPQGVSFASETRALAILDPMEGFDRRAMGKVLKLKYGPAESSLFRNVRRLAPGTLIQWCNSNVTTRCYAKRAHQVDAQTVVADREESTWLVRSAAERAIERQMIADVEVGAFLSGGIDSAITAAVMQRRVSKPLHCFTLVYPDANRINDQSESAGAREIVRHCGARHHTITCTNEKAIGTIRAAVLSLSDPICEPLLVPSWLLAQQASQHVKVVLSGEGADELFLGYDRYRAGALIGLWRMFPQGITAIAEQTARRLWGAGDVRTRLAQLARGAGSTLPWYAVFDDTEIYALTGERGLAEEIEADLGLEAIRDPIEQMAHIDFRHRLPNFILERADAMTMAHSLEMRPVFLDSELHELAINLPRHWKSGGVVRPSKAILRDAFSGGGLLPGGYVRRPKVAFSAPYLNWLPELIRDVLDRDLPLTSDCWDTVKVREFLQGPGQNSRWPEKAFCLVILTIWLAGRKR